MNPEKGYSLLNELISKMNLSLYEAMVLSAVLQASIPPDAKQMEYNAEKLKYLTHSSDVRFVKSAVHSLVQKKLLNITGGRLVPTAEALRAARKPYIYLRPADNLPKGTLNYAIYSTVAGFKDGYRFGSTWLAKNLNSDITDIRRALKELVANGNITRTTVAENNKEWTEYRAGDSR